MKEYLVKEGGVYVATGYEWSDAIEIPEGAEHLTAKTDKHLVFWKKGFKKCVGHDDDWVVTMFTPSDYTKEHEKGGAVIVWNRPNTKEYLNPADWTLHTVDVDNDAAGEDWLLVPDGAEWAKLWDKGDRYECVEFYRGDNEFFSSTKQKWMRGGDQSKNKIGKPASIVWHRHTQPEELPFIDDEPRTMGLLSNTSINAAKGHYLDNLANICGFRPRRYLETDSMYRESFIEFNNCQHEVFFVDDEPAKSTNPWKNQEGGSHYKDLKIQPMQYALENKLDYAQANVVKYVTRHANKNGKEDLLKAIHNIELMIEYYYGGDK